MDILLSTDKNYIMPTGVTMTSVCANNSQVTFHILIDKGVTELQKHQLISILNGDKEQNVKFYCIDSHFMDHFPALGKVKSYITKATYYRLFIADFLPSSVQKVIYLDGDVVNVRQLDELWGLDISDYAIGAVTDMSENAQDFNRLGYDRSNGYFNAGVLLLNVEYWRKHQLKETFLDLITNHPERIVLHDQDVLNIILHDQKYNLPMKYNVQNGFLCKREYSTFGEHYDDYEADLYDAITNPVIIHFTDNKKPWFVEDCNPLGYLWFKYYKQTEWKYMPLGHCNKSKIRYWGAKVLRYLHLLGEAKTEEGNYLTIEEIDSFKR